MKSYQEFYRDGITEIDFNSKEVYECLGKILLGNLKSNYQLNSKYAGTGDLRPDVISYDDCFIRALKENKVKEKIEEITLKEYSLFHVQVRVVSNQESYMNWHRDTYYVDGKPVGKTPNGVKLIYYPHFEKESEDRLLYLLGSNRILFPTQQFEQQLFNILSVAKISSRNDKAILFDTNGLHAVCPEKKDKKSVRIIYNFLSKKQIVDDHSKDDLHMNTMKAYEEIYK